MPKLTARIAQHGEVLNNLVGESLRLIRDQNSL